MSHKRGSSPLTRGKRVRLLNDLRQVRLIPAHAGKTVRTNPAHDAREAHPRSRGENSFRSIGGSLSSGTSPLTRGKRAAHRDPGRDIRLIPAHAGKTLYAVERGQVSEAHPRSRGENRWGRGFGAREAGSSPLTRGKLRWPQGQAVKCRLIPAHAGKTLVPTLPGVFPGAHPRSRGENHMTMLRWAMRAGSSPLTRGKRIPGRPQLRANRLIPAHAGKTTQVNVSHFTYPAHPRSRGENVVYCLPASAVAGSSPLTRGKPGPLRR